MQKEKSWVDNPSNWAMIWFMLMWVAVGFYVFEHEAHKDCKYAKNELITKMPPQILRSMQ